MKEREPGLFKSLNSYTRQRQVFASAVIFKAHGWCEWELGHAKLFGILLWQYEMKKQGKFKYSKTLKKEGYGRTHNYRLLKPLLSKTFLRKEGNGHYTLVPEDVRLIQEVSKILKQLDNIGKQAEVMQESVNTVSSERIMRKNVKQNHVG